MLRSIYISLFCVIVLTSCTTIKTDEKENEALWINFSQSDKDYHSLAQAIQKQIASEAQFDAILYVYPYTTLYTKVLDEEKSLSSLSKQYMQEEQWELCLAANRQVLAKNYTSLTAHYGASICATEKGKLKIADHHRWALSELIEAIWRTGNGKTPENPFYVTDINDLHAFIQLHQMSIVSQKKITLLKKTLFALELKKNDDTDYLLWYFDLSAQIKRQLINSKHISVNTNAF